MCTVPLNYCVKFIHFLLNMASLIKRNQDSGALVWYVQYKYEGRWIRKSLETGSKTVAQRALNKYRVLEDEDRLGLIVHKKIEVTLGEFLKVHMQHAEMKLSPKWFHDKSMFFQNQIIPFFGLSTLLKNITKARVEDYQVHRLKTVSSRTVNIEVNCLMTLLRHAVDREELEESSVPRIKKLQEVKGRVRYLEIEEIRKLRDEAQKHSLEMNIFICLMLYAGLRSGEALNLRWEDFDTERQLLYITPRGDWVPKTRTSRIVPVPDELQVILLARREQIPKAELIVKGRHTPYALTREFKKIVKNAGLEIKGDKKVTAHTLRHTYASHLVMNGKPLYTVAALLGHSDTKTTEIYAHLGQGHLQNAVQDIGY